MKTTIIEHYILEMLGPTDRLELTMRKNVRIWRYSGPYFPALGLNNEQHNSEYEHFPRNVIF